MEEIEQILKRNYNHPFYRDNPDYILKWKQYYECKKDINILFFMRQKGISKNYYWLYLAISEYFKTTSPSMATYILREAIKRDVFGVKILIKELKQYKNRDIKVNVDEIKSLLEIKSIFLWNVEWIYKKKAVDYDINCFLVGEEEKSFEEMKAVSYKKIKKNWKINDIGFYETKKIKENIFLVNNNVNYYFLVVKNNDIEIYDYTSSGIIDYEVNIKLNHYFYSLVYRNDKSIALLYDKNEILIIDESDEDIKIECKDDFFAFDYEMELLKYKICILEK